VRLHTVWHRLGVMAGPPAPVGAAGSNGPTGPREPDSPLLELTNIAANPEQRGLLCQHDLFSPWIWAGRTFAPPSSLTMGLGLP
jgi:hypothetical protein